MARKALHEFTCDAPGCKASITQEGKDLNGGAEGWCVYQVNDETFYGCCEHHLAAALLTTLGYSGPSSTLMAAVPPKEK